MTKQEALIALVNSSPLVPPNDRAGVVEKIVSGAMSEADQASIAKLLATFARAEAEEIPRQAAALKAMVASA